MRSACTIQAQQPIPATGEQKLDYTKAASHSSHRREIGQDHRQDPLVPTHDRCEHFQPENISEGNAHCSLTTPPPAHTAHKKNRVGKVVCSMRKTQGKRTRTDACVSVRLSSLSRSSDSCLPSASVASARRLRASSRSRASSSPVSVAAPVASESCSRREFSSAAAVSSAAFSWSARSYQNHTPEGVGKS